MGDGLFFQFFFFFKCPHNHFLEFRKCPIESAAPEGHRVVTDLFPKSHLRINSCTLRMTLEHKHK